MFIIYIHRTGILKHEKHLRLLSSGTKLFITFADFSICPKPRAHPTQSLSELAKVNLLLPRLELNWLFSNLPKSSALTSGAWHHSHPPVTFPIWDFYFDISEWHILPAHAWTPALMLHLTNPCAKRKVLSLTKPKGKIYKMKSLGHYITNISSWTRMKLFQTQKKEPSQLGP